MDRELAELGELDRFGEAARATSDLGELATLMELARASGVKGADRVVAARATLVRALAARASLASRGAK